MGLDISAFEYLDRETWCSPDEGIEDHEDALYVYNDGWPQYLEGIQAGYYDAEWDHAYSFRAGSYSWYNWWRSALCKLALSISYNDFIAKIDEYSSMPFYELLNHSDGKGCIGPVVSAKLYKDFVDNRETLLVGSQAKYPYSYWAESYDEWLKAFEIASNAGVVCFH